MRSSPSAPVYTVYMQILMLKIYKWDGSDGWKSPKTKEHCFAMLIKVWNKNDKNRKIPRKLHFVSSLAVPRSFSGPVKSRPPVNLTYIHFPRTAPFQWIFQTLFELHFSTDSFFNSITYHCNIFCNTNHSKNLVFKVWLDKKNVSTQHITCPTSICSGTFSQNTRYKIVFRSPGYMQDHVQAFF